MEPIKPVNLPLAFPDINLPTVDLSKGLPSKNEDPLSEFNRLVSNSIKKENVQLPTVSGELLPKNERYEQVFQGIDNEDYYAQQQTFLEKGKNGVAKFLGITGATALQGTVGLVAGLAEFAKTKKFVSTIDNPISESLNSYIDSLDNTYANYKTARERNGSWWEPENLFTGNFLFDNIVSNLGYAAGAMIAGYGVAGAMSGVGKMFPLLRLVGNAIGTGAKGASAAETAIAGAMEAGTAESLAAANTELQSYWNGVRNSIAKGVESFDRNIAAISGSFSEGSMEAYRSMHEFRNNAIDNYIAKYGKAPSGKDLEDINSMSENVGKTTLGLNVALLSITNSVMFPKIVSSSFKSERGVLTGITREAVKGSEKSVAKQYVSSLPEKGFGKFLYKGYKGLGLLFSGIEAFEEGSQYAIETGVSNYYNKKLNKKDANLLEDLLGYGVREALTTDEGLLNIVTGGLSGGLMTAGYVGIKDGKIAFGKTGKLAERGAFGYGGEENKLRNEAISAFNKNTLNNLMNISDNVQLAEKIQQDRTEAIKNGDVLESKDLEFDYAHSFIETRLKYGAGELIYDEINELKQEAVQNFDKLIESGYANATDTKESYLRRLDQLEQQARYTEKINSDLYSKYAMLADPKDISKRLYSDNVIDKLTYGLSKIHNYNLRIQQLNTSLLGNNVNVSNLLQIINESKDVKETAEKLNSILTKVKVVKNKYDELKEVTDSKEILDRLDAENIGLSKDVESILNVSNSNNLTITEKENILQDAIDVLELGLRRQNVYSEYNDIVENPQKYDFTRIADIAPETDSSQGTESGKTSNQPSANEKFSILTKLGKKDVGKDKSYYVIKQSESDDPVFKFTDSHEFKLLGLNEEGKIQIQLTDNRIFTLNSDYFKDLVLVDKESVSNNKMMAFVYSTMNKLFEYNFGKDDKFGRGKIKGKLSHDGNTNKTYFNYYRKDENGNVITDKNGKVKMYKVEVFEKDFKAQKNYKYAKVRPIGDLTKVQQESFDSMLSGTDKKSIAERVSSLVIVDDIIEDINSKLTEIDESINKYKEQIDKLSENIEKHKSVENPTDYRIKQIKALIRTREKIAKHIEDLEDTKELLQIKYDNIVSASEILENDVAETSSLYKDLYMRLYEKRKIIQETIEKTSESINVLEKLIRDTVKLIKKLSKPVVKAIDAFNKKYPGSPFDRDGINKYIEENNKKRNKYRIDVSNILTDLENLDNQISTFENKEATYEPFLEDANIELSDLKESLKENEKQVKVLNELLASLRDSSKEYDSYVKKILNGETLPEDSKLGKFYKNAIDVIKEKAKTFEKLREQFFGTKDTGEPTRVRNYESPYEPDPKKDKDIIIRSGRAYSGLSEGLQPHHVRVDLFGKNLNTIKNSGKNVKAVLITKDNENEFFAKGLIEKYFVNYDRAIIILAVREDATTGKLIPIDENGNDISETEVLEKGIFQAMPSEKLSNKSGDSMFRENQKEYEQSYTELYKKQTDSILQSVKNNPTLPLVYNLEVSFGIPEYVVNTNITDKDGNHPRDFKAQTPISEIDIIDNFEEVIEKGSRNVIEIPLEDKLSNDLGTTTFDHARGRLFINTGENYVPVNNNRHNEETATAIYDAVLRLSMLNKIKDNPEAIKLINWLRTVVYWGEPFSKITATTKPLTFNSIFFKTDEDGNLKLYISKNNQSFSFDPVSLRSQKTQLIKLFQELYHNVNRERVSSPDLYNSKYEQIISVSENGEVTSVIWPNYQTYLLSAKDTEGNKRKVIPVTSNMRPIESSQDSNRKFLYLILPDLDIVDYSSAEKNKVVNKKQTPSSSAQTPSNPKSTEKPKAPVPNPQSSQPVEKYKGSNFVNETGIIIEDGKTINVIERVSGTLNEIVAIQFTTFKSTENGKVGNKINFIDKNLDSEQFYKNLKDLISSETRDKILPSFIKTVNSKVENFKKPSEPEIQETKPSEPSKPEEASPAVDSNVNMNSPTTDAIKTPKRSSRFTSNPDKENFRVSIIPEVQSSYEKENWKEVENWISKNFPNIPVYRVTQAIITANGRQAWGMLKNGAIYLYENAEVGTAYHEVFEAVWKMLVLDSEKSKLYSEFKNRKGKFFDRESLKYVEYSNVTDHQIKERLAEEFSEYVRNKKAHDNKSLLRKIFDDIINFFKEFFIGEKGELNSEKLFSKIGNGYYANYNPYESKLNFSNSGFINIEKAILDGNEEFRHDLIGFTEVQWDDLMQHLTYYTIARFLPSQKNPNRSIFNYDKINSKEFYDISENGYAINAILNDIEEYNNQLLDKYEEAADNSFEKKSLANSINSNVDLMDRISDNWEFISQSHKDYLIPYGITFDENNEELILDETSNGKNDYIDHTRVDWFKSSSAGLKLYLSSIPEIDNSGNVVLGSTMGYKLIPLSKVRSDFQKAIQGSTNVDMMISRLKQLGSKNRSYQSFVEKRLTFGLGYNNFDLSKLKSTSQTSIITSLWNMFAKTNPTVLNLYILENGDITLGEAAYSKETEQAYIDMENDIKINNKIVGAYNSRLQGYPINEIKIENLNKIESQIEFLNLLGIDSSFLSNVKKLANITEKNRIVNNLYDKLTVVKNIIEAKRKNEKLITKVTLSNLGITGFVRELAEIKTKVSNVETSFTFFNALGELTQSYIGTNLHSDIYDAIQSVSNLTDLATTRFKYLLTDSFSKGSVILDKIFSEDNKKRTHDENLLKNGYLGAMVNLLEDDITQSSRLSYMKRLVSVLNLIIDGYYPNLVPGDGSMEHITYLGDFVEMFSGNKQNSLKIANPLKVEEIFKNYFISEVNVARENREIIIPKNSGRSPKDLRFLQFILGKETLDKVNSLIDDSSKSALDIYEIIKDKLNEDVYDYSLFGAIELYDELYRYNLIKYEGSSEDIYAQLSELEEYGNLNDVNFEKVTRNLSKVRGYISNVKLPEISGMDSKEVENNIQESLRGIVLNFMIANIELHKLIYSDPYLYKDEIKRLKNLNSPAIPIAGGSLNLNFALTEVWNKIQDSNDIGHVDFTDDSFRSIIIKDVDATLSTDAKEVDQLLNYDTWEEGDGGGIITMQGIKKLKVWAGDWSEKDDLQYNYEIAWEKQDKGIALTDYEQELLEKYGDVGPQIQSAFTPYKPKVTGNKANGKSYNDMTLHKYALFTISYRMSKIIGNGKETNMTKLYNKLEENKIDYAVFSSGAKVGATKIHDVYDENGKFILDNLGTVEDGGVSRLYSQNLTNQSDVPTKEQSESPTGTQSVKLMTLDFTDNGVPIDFRTDLTNQGERLIEWYNLSYSEKLENSELYKEIENNRNVIEAMIDNGIDILMKKLGISKKLVQYIDENGNVKTQYEFNIKNKKVALETLKSEMLKREVNQNMIDSIESFMDGNEMLLEASPAYQQLRNILFSIANKNVIKRTMLGGQKVQMPSSFFESKDRKVVKLKNGKVAYTSDLLKFYNDIDPNTGKPIRICEIMVRRWFDSSLSDEELLKYLNETEEGQSVLKGIAYRIPTQKQNSIESFRIAKFLPKEYGDVVIVPSALVKKVGSDFDIDKLFMYFKHVIVDGLGYPKLYKFLTKENSRPEQRYYRWVISLSNSDTINYIKYLSKDQVSDNLKIFKDRLSELKFEKNNEIKKIKEDFYNKLIENYNQIESSSAEEYESGMKDLFASGKEIFKFLSKDSKKYFFDLKNKMKEESIEGIVEIKNYLNLAQGLSELNDVSQEDKNILKSLIDTYEEELALSGLTRDSIQNLKKEALSKFKNEKDESIKSVKELTDESYLNNITEFSETDLKIMLDRAIEIANIENLETYDEFLKRSDLKQNIKEVLQNEYIKSSQNLISHELNYNRLIEPNSADYLKDLTKRLLSLKGQSPVDYSSVSSMLSLTKLAKIRYNLVTGKYAIGIAALAQTLHSTLQKTQFYIDKSNYNKIDEKDAEFLGNWDISFEYYNKVQIGNSYYPSLSGIKDGYNSTKDSEKSQYISDIIGAFIDGYVDISKDDWIMLMGATPEVAATYLFLISLGVPTKDVVFFMNQPIILSYLEQLESEDSRYLFSRFAEDHLSNYTEKSLFELNRMTGNKIPSLDKLEEMVSKDWQSMTVQEREDQAFIFAEFLKYSKMSEQLYYVTQGTNFDTASLNDPLLIFKKLKQLEKAKSTIFTGVDEFLENSFVGNLVTSVESIRKIMSNFLMSEKDNVAVVIESMLEKYINLPDKSFLKLSRKLISDIFDYAVQTNYIDNIGILNSKIESLLVSENNAGKTLKNFIKSVKSDPNHPLYYNYLLDMLDAKGKDVEGAVTNIYLKNKSGKIYDQNRVIFGFKKLKEYFNSLPKNSPYADFYDKIIISSVLQSGISTSPISFTSLIPYEDFRRIYGSILSNISNISNIEDFKNTSAFYRNNWNNTDLVPRLKLKVIYTEYGKFKPQFETLPKELKKAVKDKKMPRVAHLSNSSSEFYTMTWSDLVETEDYSKKRVYRKILLKQVTDNQGYPVYIERESKDGKVYRNYIYKQINAWGQGIYANEFYSKDGVQSKINNEYEKPINEVSDEEILKYYNPETLISDVPKSNINVLNQNIESKEILSNSKNLDWKEEDNNDTCVPF